MIVVVMGVSGSGKTEIGSRLAERLGCEFIEGDDFHPPHNVAKMRSGTPLEDADRWPWLQRLNEELKKRKNAVLACSALKQAYRDALLKDVPGGTVVHLRGSYDLIASRLKGRRHRYMPASLLESQFATLQPPAGAIDVDVGASVKECVEAIALRLAG